MREGNQTVVSSLEKMLIANLNSNLTSLVRKTIHDLALDPTTLMPFKPFTEEEHYKLMARYIDGLFHIWILVFIVILGVCFFVAYLACEFSYRHGRSQGVVDGWNGRECKCFNGRKAMVADLEELKNQYGLKNGESEFIDNIIERSHKTFEEGYKVGVGFDVPVENGKA